MGELNGNAVASQRLRKKLGKIPLFATRPMTLMSKGRAREKPRHYVRNEVQADTALRHC
jgi:hypothetical protein